MTICEVSGVLNDFVWKTYLEANGKDVVKCFEDAFTNGPDDKYADKIKELHSAFCPSEDISQGIIEQILDIVNQLQSVPDLDSVLAGEDGFEQLKDFLSEDCRNEKDLLDCFLTSIAYYSTFLTLAEPCKYIPYYFQMNFNIVEKIAEEFDIQLPPVPAKKDYIERIDYYISLCNAFYEFADEHNMTSFELFAFLYDFAPKYLGGWKSYIVEDLPEPKSAYFIGAGKDDLFLKNGASSITPWQCNPDTQAGDMIVMYKRAPVSAVDSVWRSVSIGFNDPFFWFYRCTYIGNCVAVHHLSLKDMMKDKVLKEMPIVKKNMQGVNGVEIMPSQYNHILDVTKANKSICRFEDEETNMSADLRVEKDVENKLIIPLLAKLGYEDSDFVRQLNITVGNNNYVLIPDFVLLPKKKNGHYTAFAVIEAKFNIKSKKELEMTQEQALSYARQLDAKYAVVVDKNKLHIFAEQDGYNKVIFEMPMAKAGESDTLSKLRKIIGKK